MNAVSFKAAVEDLIAKVVGGKSLDAFDRYYAERRNHAGKRATAPSR